jgi:hypothetical protein
MKYFDCLADGIRLLMAIKGSLAHDESAPRDDTDDAERRRFSVHARGNDG